jgi:nitroimidazol reductase NimA-like FMN-containing flavoprotein (pyridoxamine 5'-phosphate oxidase superfamily)
MTQSHELSAQECEQLLQAGVAGRVAMCTPTGPHIVPVNYAVVDATIVIRTSPYSLLGSHGRDTTLAFEVDGFDPEHQRGWSVQARGHAEEVTDREELARLRSTAAQEPWASGARVLVLRLRWSELSGRRLSDERTPRVSPR